MVTTRFRAGKAPLILAAALSLLAAACMMQAPGAVERHRWWSGLGPVLPHSTFPADCQLCHVGENWQSVTKDFEFDHEAETGVPLEGAHANARCLRCHNDRGPVSVFAGQGCAGCHEDIHLGRLGALCTTCHQEVSWEPVGQVELHNRTRFPLIGVHATTTCRRCHEGAWIGVFFPTDVRCETCHQDDLARTVNHLGLGWVDQCNRCHMPTKWEDAELDLGF